jgi:hypothetical protein
VERALATVTELALRNGALAGLDALLRLALRLTGVAGIALHEGRACIAEAGLRPPPLSRARAAQVIPAGDGRAALVVLPERIGLEEREVLERLARLGATLLAARRRERAAQARQRSLCNELRGLKREVAHRERSRSVASHDLRTPLLVIKGYVDMMRKGMTGELTPTMERYLERMMSATQDMGALISKQLAPGSVPEDLLTLLSASFETVKRARPVCVRLECEAKSVPIRGPGAVVALLARTLARDAGATGARTVSVAIEAKEKLGMWKVRLSTDKQRALPARKVARLEHLVLRLGGTLSLQDEAPFELRLLLPAALEHRQA